MGNCGDSRFIYSSNGELVRASEDHKPENPGEKKRIEEAGGKVINNRINRDLNVSRGFADVQFKGLTVDGDVDGEVVEEGRRQPLTICDPDLFLYERSDGQSGFVVLVTDGITDKVTSKNLHLYVKHQLTVTKDSLKICEQLNNVARNLRSHDNLTTLLLVFGPSTISIEKQEDYKNNLKKLKDKVQVMLATSPKMELWQLFPLLRAEDSINSLFPPFGVLSE